MIRGQAVIFSYKGRKRRGVFLRQLKNQCLVRDERSQVWTIAEWNVAAVSEEMPE